VEGDGFSSTAGTVGVQWGQTWWPLGKRRWQMLHSRGASHSGQRFQFSLTGWPQTGQVNSTRRVSHTGQMRQFGCTGSLQFGQWDGGAGGIMIPVAIDPYGRDKRSSQGSIECRFKLW